MKGTQGDVFGVSFEMTHQKRPPVSNPNRGASGDGSCLAQNTS